MNIPGGYPCRICGKRMMNSSEGRGFIAGKYRFVACNGCAPKIEVAARTTATVVKTGLAALINTRAPGLMPVLKQLQTAYVNAKQDTQP